MFPSKPVEQLVPANYNYPAPLPLGGRISENQIKRHIAKLSPHKATGTDKVPNIVLKECADLVLPYLLQVFRAVFKLKVYHAQWREIITCVLRKPGKPCYDMPKAYQPITLLNTIAKLLTSVIAEELSILVETHQLLPVTHFGGRPSCMMTDSLHLLMDTVKAVWQKKQVVSTLFLDVEGAFPNAVTHRLLHNMKKRRVPAAYVAFISNLLTGRRTHLKFDDYTLDWFDLDSGIGQGDPLSMLLYLFYNADLLDIAVGWNEKALGYVDDIALVVFTKNFTQTHRILKNMMLQPKGAFRWSKSHNSHFETTKSVIIDFSRSKSIERPPLSLRGTVIPAQASHKFVGVMVDQELQWAQHADYATAKATKWMLAFHRLVRPSAGIRPRLLHQMYNAMAIPKMTYAADVWYTPVYRIEGRQKRSGSVGITRRLTSIQHLATTAITGALQSTATDVLDLHANVLSIELLLHCVCHRAAVRLAMLPASHPLAPVFRMRAK